MINYDVDIHKGGLIKKLPKFFAHLSGVTTEG